VPAAIERDEIMTMDEPAERIDRRGGNLQDDVTAETP